MADEDPMADPDRCTATASSTGERCKQPAIPGSNVCRFHGGAAEQVEKKAQERLDRMADEVTADMQSIIDDLAAEYDQADREEKVAIHRELHKTWRAILDRTGHGPTEKHEHTGEDGGPVEIALNETIVETDYDE